MSFFLNSILKAFKLIFTFNPKLLEIITLSIMVSGLAIIISSIIGLYMAILLVQRDFYGKQAIINAINTFMGLPPVVVGLFLYMLLSRSGPLGFLNILYTPTAMIIAQVILATPIIAGLSYASIVSADPTLRFTALTLGATHFQATLRVIRDVRYGILASVMAGLGRVMAEVGAVLIVGGNIAGYTRVMTTTIALEADRGDFELAITLGIILLLITFLVNGTLFILQKRQRG